ncbi:adenine nucleotide alpha hydrolases-like protein [Venturia nashicola]|nr:adenine nucleotide alpha hydrolases-like protein [Venturia nashicola]
MSSLNVIALISGGKDSFFSILHCQANGHQVIALANLYPEISREDSENEDIDSFMYQTVGHSVVPIYAEALGIPLYRQKILGGSGSMERDYALATTDGDEEAQEEDETESLVPLLKRVKEAHPDANALSTGAILSTYQRTRIESVALRLGLVPLSYLWQYPLLPPYTQTSLLEDMRAAGQDSRIIKVASGALDESFLWKNVADHANVTKMVNRMEMFGGSSGGAVLGEGGEFETLAVDGPGPLWKSKIEAGNVEVVKGEGGSAVVRLKDVRVVKKEEAQKPQPELRIPELLDTEFKALLTSLETTITSPDGHEEGDQSLISIRPRSDTSIDAFKSSNLRLRRPQQGMLQISNIYHSSGTPSDQLKSILQRLSTYLGTLNLDASSLVFTTLLLRSMTDFTLLNPIYGSIFTAPNPPSRVTISCGDRLPPGVDVVLSTIVDLGERKERQGLHVQSRSYWAPANIGPYSQAISIPFDHLPAPPNPGEQIKEEAHQEDDNRPRIIHIAGQIPLVPCSMEIINPKLLPFTTTTTSPSKSKDFIAQTILSLQHLFRIGRAMNVQSWTSAVAFISSCPPSEGTIRAKIAIKAWKKIHQQALTSQTNADKERDDDDDDNIDIWDLQNRYSRFQTQAAGTTKKDVDTRGLLPNYSTLEETEVPLIPPVFVAQVAELPRGAHIEWFSNGLSNPVLSIKSPQIWIPISSMDDFVMPTGKEGVRCEYTVYTTRALPVTLMHLNLVIIPCYRVWCEKEDGGDGAVEIEAVLGIRQYRI